MIINTAKEYLSKTCGVKNSGQLSRETGLPSATCRYFWGHPKRCVSDRVCDILCQRYRCQLWDLKRYVKDEVQYFESKLAGLSPEEAKRLTKIMKSIDGAYQ